MAASVDYQRVISDCLRWAESADSPDAFDAFLALAETWKRIAELEQRLPGKRLATPQRGPTPKPTSRALDAHFIGDTSPGQLH